MNSLQSKESKCVIRVEAGIQSLDFPGLVSRCEMPGMTIM